MLNDPTDQMLWVAAHDGFWQATYRALGTEDFILWNGPDYTVMVPDDVQWRDPNGDTTATFSGGGTACSTRTYRQDDANMILLHGGRAFAKALYVGHPVNKYIVWPMFPPTSTGGDSRDWQGG